MSAEEIKRTADDRESWQSQKTLKPSRRSKTNEKERDRKRE